MFVQWRQLVLAISFYLRFTFGRVRQQSVSKLTLRKHLRCAQGHWTFGVQMKTIGLFSIFLTASLLVACGLMPPRRQYIKEAKRQIIPKELLNTHWTLESWDGKAPDCKLTMDFYAKGQFGFKWNDIDFTGDNLWYIVKDSAITFQTRPIEKIVWTTEKHELEPDNFALDLRAIKNFKIVNDKLVLTSKDKTFIFKKS